ncbi:MAG TPA: methyltransferase domain-containing protein [Flavisolibacter sp.]
MASTPKTELYDTTYRHAAEDLYREIRQEAFGMDIGQTSWLTAVEYRTCFSLLQLTSGMHVLEVAPGTGGPAVFMVQETGCHVTGMDINAEGVLNARHLAREHQLEEKLTFLQGDAAAVLPFKNAEFDAVVCIDAINHLDNRPAVLSEWHRVLKPGGRLLYTDPVVVTGIVSNEELAVRSSIGFFLFSPPGENERLLQAAGFHDIAVHDVTGNMEHTSGKWAAARDKRKEQLMQFEEETNFNGLQAFLDMVHRLSGERRLSRMLFNAVK